MTMRHNFYGGKYTVVFSGSGELSALRYGEPWRSLSGDGMVLSMLQAVDAERALLARSQIVINAFKNHIDEDTSLAAISARQLCDELEKDITDHLEEQNGA